LIDTYVLLLVVSCCTVDYCCLLQAFTSWLEIKWYTPASGLCRWC